MSKVAFCFPGQGSLEVGMGREIAEAVPEAMDVYRVGSEATGMDLAQLSFEGPLEELVETEVQQPTLVATSLAILAAVRKALDAFHGEIKWRGDDSMGYDPDPAPPSVLDYRR